MVGQARPSRLVSGGLLIRSGNEGPKQPAKDDGRPQLAQPSLMLDEVGHVNHLFAFGTALGRFYIGSRAFGPNGGVF